MDPLNLTNFWTIQEASAATANTWDTWWAQIQLCTPPPAVTGSTGICIGSTTALIDATTGGTWSSSNTLIASVSSATGIVTGIESGSVTVTYATGSSCSATIIVTVNPPAPAITGSAAVCNGSTITLSDVTTGGAWSSSATAVATIDDVSGIIYAIAPGTATITYAPASGCPVTTVVSVNALPPGITGAVLVCTSATITLSDGASGGVWSSDNAGVASVSTTGVVSGLTPGSADISYTLTNGCGTNSVTQTVSVNPAPSAGSITGAATTCVGTSTALTDIASGGVWSSSSNGIATVDGFGNVTGVAVGNATISYTVAGGCGPAIAVSIVTVNGVPSAGTITGTATLCVAGTTTLRDLSSGGLWSSGSTGIATVTVSGVVTGVAAGSAAISYTVTNGCGSATTSSTVTVNAPPTAGTIAGTAAICPGATVALSDATASASGVWSSGNTGIATVNTSGTVTGVSAGTANISYTVTTTCGTAIAAGMITVNPAPTAGTITGTATVCVGATTALSNTTAGGVWTSSSATIASVGTTGIVTGGAAGTASISYTVTNTCGSAITSKIVTVNAAPSTAGTITGTATVCTSATTALANTTTGGVWSSSSSAIASVGTTGVIKGVAAGEATISYTVTNTCGSAFTTKVVTVNAAPSTAGTISGTATVCVSATTALSDGTTGGVWSSSTTTVASVGTTGIVKGVAAGTATISYKVTNTCGSIEATKVVTVSATPTVATISGSTSVAVGATITLTDATTGGVWNSSSTAKATVSTAGVVKGVATGSATISYTVTNSCGTAHATKSVTVTAAKRGGRESSPGNGEDNAPVSSFQVYPNPTTGTFTVTAPNAGVLHLISMDGKEAGRFEVQDATSSFRIPDGLAPGLYIYQFVDDNGVATTGRLVYKPRR